MPQEQDLPNCIPMNTDSFQGGPSVPPSPVIKGLARRLRVGQRWLTDQRRLSLGGDPAAASSKKFREALVKWHDLERELRQADYAGCIWGPGNSCPSGGFIVCDSCFLGVDAG